MKAFLGLLLVLVGGFVLYKVLPVYWADFKLGRMLEEQAIVYTYANKSEGDVAAAIAEKAHSLDIPLSPDQVKVKRTGSELSIVADYTVHVDMPIYPLDLNFKTSTKNKDVMAK